MKKPPADPEDLAGGVPRLAIYYAEHPEEYGDLIDDMLDRRLLTLDDWREFIECMTAEQQNRMIREFLKVGLATERPGPNGTFVYTLRFPIPYPKPAPKPEPTDEQVVYLQQFEEWVRQYDALVAKGPHASAAEWASLLGLKPKRPRVRLKQYDNVTQLVIAKRVGK
jgi:hypothetical protein